MLRLPPAWKRSSSASAPEVYTAMLGVETHSRGYFIVTTAILRSNDS